ncbi:hypothetical protein EC991_000946 [Linnemannia zychae]|nr:hypothetical protein EC991_000946 [Linnemannia zychae]
MPTSTPLPIEILSYIFLYLEPLDLYQCLVVSRVWHAQAEAQLYSDVLLDVNYGPCNPLLSALKTRRHLLRSLHWRYSSARSTGPQFDLMDILLDYRPHDTAGNDQGDHGGDISLDDGHSIQDDIDSGEDDSDEYNSSSSERLKHFTATLANKLGPNRPIALKKFSFVGSGVHRIVLESMIYCLTTLTTLELSFVYSPTAKVHRVDVERILESLPCLKELVIEGWMHDYVSVEESAAARAQSKDYGHQMASAGTTTMGSKTPYRLEKFTFDVKLTHRAGPDAFGIFKRMGNLKRIRIKSFTSQYECAQMSRPWALGRVLREFCPGLEAIETEGCVALWLFDLPILPSLTTPQQHGAAALEKEMGVTLQQLRRRLQEQEEEELLRGQTAVPFFPQLRELEFGPENTFTYQDLISLGVQARFLTTLTIQYEEPQRNLLWELYEIEAPYARTSSTTSASGGFVEEALIEAMRLRKRRPFIPRDLVLFLWHCSSLRHLSVSNVSIPSQYLADLADTEQGTEEAPHQLFTRPWACEATLETLSIRIHVETIQRKTCHALVWGHLGRLRNLRSLNLRFSKLDPSFSHGIEDLLIGGLAATIKEIRHLPRWWKVEAKERKALVLLFARSCPRLEILGLEYKQALYVDEEGVVEGTMFLEDEEVKQCGILKVFIEGR